EACMPVNLSIKNAPDELVERLRKRAKRRHRSLQGELLAIIEEAGSPQSRITVHERVERNRALGLRTPDEVTRMIREDRDR
ncbi:MAG TPA: Arc family DNA-binding protein, partial [Rhizomicrobium sp.]